MGGAAIRIRILGTAAGGGFPQWNCRCRYCEASRRGLIPARLQASLALSPDRRIWYLVNATPDVTSQLGRWPELRPQTGIRHTPVQGVLLTDGELDHTLGLLHLREGGEVNIYCAAGVARMLENDLRVLPALRCYASSGVRVVEPAEAVSFGDDAAGFSVQWLETGRDSPRYAGPDREIAGAVMALLIRDFSSGRRLVYAPGAGMIDDELLAALRDADAVLFDGTFWSEEEFPEIGGGQRSARDMGHLPVGGPEGSAVRLAELPAKLKRYVHINNTNPLLDPQSEQRQMIRELGLDLAEDGEEVEL